VGREHRQTGRHHGRVQVVHTVHVRHGKQVAAYRRQVDPGRRGLREHVDRLAQQAPRPGQDQPADEQRCEGIRPGPAGQRSLALLADAGHALTDAAGLSLSLVAAVLSAGAGADTRTWGFRRTEVLAAAAQAAVLLAVGVFILVEAVRRSSTPARPRPLPAMIVFGLVGLVGNIVSIGILAGVRGADMNARAAFLQVVTDALGSVAVLTAAVVIARDRGADDLSQQDGGCRGPPPAVRGAHPVPGRSRSRGPSRIPSAPPWVTRRPDFEVRGCVYRSTLVTGVPWQIGTVTHTLHPGR
jgi:hypothetical protein